MHYLHTSFLTVLLLSAASAAPAVELAGQGVTVRIFQAEEKGQSATVATTPDGTPAVRLNWDNAKRKYTEFSLQPAIALPAFESGRIAATVFIPENPQVRNFSVRIADADNEVFQYVAPIGATDSGWKTLIYDIDVSNPSKSSWGEKKNGKFNLPLRIAGAAGEFRSAQGQGELFVKSIDFTVIEEARDLVQLADFANGSTAIALRGADDLRQSAKVAAMPDGRDALRIGWEDTPAKHFEFALRNAPVLPEFDKVRLRARVYLPADPQLTTLALRLRDRDGEIFQIPARITPGPEGWRDLYYDVDLANVRGNHWGGGSKANGKMDLPLRLQGVAGDFKAAGSSGWIGLGTIGIQSLSGGQTVRLDVKTGNPIHVLVPGQEDELALSVTGTVFNVTDKPLVLEYTLSDVDGRVLQDERLELILPAGSSALLFPLPSPEALGVYYIEAALTEVGGAAKKKRLSFSYMPPAGPTPGHTEGFIFGICSHPQRSTARDQELEAMAAAWAGAKAIRTDINWERMQPSPDRWDFQPFDQTIGIFEQWGIELQPIYSYLPLWATAEDWVPLKDGVRGKPRPDYEHWRTFVRTFAERYKGRIHYVEVWNEPDLIGFANFSVDEYIRMLKIAYEETKLAAPEITVFTGGYTAMPRSGGKVDPFHMIRTLREAKGYYDVHAFHGHGSFNGYYPQIEELVRLHERMGVDVPWYANETAVPSVHIGEKNQAITLFQKLIYSWARGSIGYNWYNLRNDGFDPNNNEHNFGLITRDFYPKAAYPAYNMLARVYGGAVYVRDIALGQGASGYLFKGKDGGFLIANWDDSPDYDNRIVLLDGITGTASRIDLFGNESAVKTSDGLLYLQIGREPATLKLSGQSAEPVVLGEIAQLKTPFVVSPGEPVAIVFELSNPTQRTLEFDAALVLPEGLSATQGQRQIRLAPGARADISFTVSADAGYSVGTGVEAFAALHLTLPGHLDVALKYPVGMAVRVPFGSAAAEPQFRLERSEQVTALIPHDPANEHLFWKGPADLSAQVRLGWTADALLMEVVVTDNVHVQPYRDGGVWNGDNVQFSLLLPGQNRMWELGLTRTDAGTSEVFCWHAPAGFDAAAVAKSVSLETTRDETEKTTTYLCRIPLQAIGLSADAAQSEPFRFNLIVNDNDGDIRKGFIAISPGMGVTRTPRAYPLILFSKP